MIYEFFLRFDIQRSAADWKMLDPVSWVRRCIYKDNSLQYLIYPPKNVIVSGFLLHTVWTTPYLDINGDYMFLEMHNTGYLTANIEYYLHEPRDTLSNMKKLNL